jgi:hypothetical protein
MNKIQACVVLGCLAGGAPSAQATNLILNGSFEDVSTAGAVRLNGVGTVADTSDGIDDGNWAVFTQLPGLWTTASGPGIEVRNNVAGVAQDGDNFVELDSHGADPSNSFMTQTFTSPGTMLKLSFWYAARPGAPGNDPASNGIEVLWNGVVLTAPPLVPGNPALGTTDTEWVEYSAPLTGVVGNNTLGFRAVGIDETYGGSLDNVSVTVVPEPEAYGLALAGMGVVALSVRRRRGQHQTGER